MALIVPDGCKNCRHVTRNAQALECHEGPPTPHPLKKPGPRGAVNIVGMVTIFPQVQPEWKCSRWAKGLLVAAA